MRLAPVLISGVIAIAALPGCTPSNQTKPDVMQTSKFQPDPAASSIAQPDPAESSKFQPDPAGSSVFQPDQTEASVTEASVFKPTIAQVNQAQQQLGAQTSDREVRIVLPADVLFDFDKDTIRPDAATALQQTLTVIRFYENSPVRIEGHTDSMGDDAYNQALSDRRAASVQQWLITNGQVGGDRMMTRGLGETQPRAENAKPDGSDDPAGRQLNRRVEIVVEKQ